MSNSALKPTFITLGHIRIRRKLFAGIMKENDGIGVLIGTESPYKEYVNDEDDAEDIIEDYQRLKENKML